MRWPPSYIVKKFYSRVSINRFAFAFVCTNNIQETGNSWQRGIEIVWKKDGRRVFTVYKIFFKIFET